MVVEIHRANFVRPHQCPVCFTARISMVVIAVKTRFLRWKHDTAEQMLQQEYQQGRSQEFYLGVGGYKF